MRCSHYVPAARRTKQVSVCLDHQVDNSKKNADHQPSSNLEVHLQQAGSPALRLSPARGASRKCAANSSSSAIKRALRDATSAKSQSCVKPENIDNSTSLGDVHIATTVLPGHIKHPRMTNSSSSSSSSSTSSVSSSPSSASSQQATADLLRVGRPNSRPSEPKTGGGRHPHPPTGNNSKLKHKCPFDGCPWRFATPYKLRRHIKSHTKETPYRCKECDRGFSVRYNLLMHIQTIHSQPQRFKCPLPDCKEAFHSQSRLNGHLRRVHKSDWKSLQGIKETPKYNSRRGGSISSTDSSDSLPDAVPAPPSRRTSRASSSMHKCQKCGEEFSSKAKLNAHNKLHSAQEKETLKCTVEACGKAFSNAGKLARHLESHGSKTSKQLSCPHKNCNRIFLKANLLECHKRIHTQEDVFICPVPDCRQQFSSEESYNLHLNTHVCYGHSCPYPNCDVTFLTQNRLDIHMQVVHGNMPSGSILDGIQPHHGDQLEHCGAPSQLCIPSLSSPNSPAMNATAMSPTAPTPVSAQAGPIRCVLENDFLKYMDLPGLTADDVRAALLEHKNWSGEQLDQFLRSAVDLSEIESRLSTWCSYESDSGYSTFDVSPITNNAPTSLNFAGPSQMLGGPAPNGVHSPPHHHQHHQPCPPLSLNLLDQSNSSPLFNNPPFMTLPLQPSSSSSSSTNGLQATSPMGATPLLHDPMSSPCASDAGFFSPHFLNTAQDQDCNTFFSNHSPMSMAGTHSFPPPTDYNLVMGRTSSNGDIFCPNAGPCFPDVLQSISMPPLSDPFINEFCQSQLPICSLSNPSMGPADLTFLDCTANNNSQELPPPFPVGAGIKLEGHNSSLPGDIPLELDMIPTIPNIKQEIEVRPLLTSMDRRESLDCRTVSPTSPLSVSSQFSMTSEPPTTMVDPTPSPPTHPTTTRSVSMKAGKRKSQWPKSINRASLMAFRERILSKLKNTPESKVAAIPVSQSQSNIVNFEVGEVEYLESLLN